MKSLIFRSDPKLFEITSKLVSLPVIMYCSYDSSSRIWILFVISISHTSISYFSLYLFNAFTVKVNFDPLARFPSSKNIFPSKASTIYLQMFKPNPIPDVLISVVASSFPNILKSLDLSSFLIPIPESVMLTCNSCYSSS